ncbi:hypothetical protein BD309DRAFT_599912, partial [Dichomitus squalens]
LGHLFDPLVTDKASGRTTRAQSNCSSERRCLLRRLVPYVSDLGPPAICRWLLDMFPHKGVQQLKSIVGVMHERSLEIFQLKKQALEQGDEAVAHQVGEGKDIMSILLKANVEASQEDKLPEEEILAQMSTFILAGMDTTSTALSIT